MGWGWVRRHALPSLARRGTGQRAVARRLRLFAHRLNELPQAVPYLLLGLDYFLEEPKRVVIVGDPNAANTRSLIHAAHSVYQPNKVVLGNVGLVESFAKTLPTKGAPSVYLCTGTACQPPTNDTARIKEMLNSVSSGKAGSLK